jgi:2-oxoglutarate dehydrogenase E1 component
MDKFSYISNAEGAVIDDLYKSYLKDENSVDESWKKFFEGFDFAKTNFKGAEAVPDNVQKEFKVIKLIGEYRSRGHLFTDTNPVRERRKYKPSLDYQNFKLEESDLNVVFKAGEEIGLENATLQDIIDHLQEVVARKNRIKKQTAAFKRKKDSCNA